MPREPIPTWFFVKVVVRLGDRFLLVQERRFDQTWHLPAGRAELGEGLASAAVRETMEEAAVPVILDGIVRVEHSPRPDKAYVGVVFIAHPAADVAPKSTPDEESLGAAWFTLAEAEKLPLREPDVPEILRYVQSGGAAYPVSLLAAKGEAYRGPV